MQDSNPQPPNKTAFVLVTVLGLVLLCAAVLMEARWGWVGVWPSILVNLGTTLMLAFALLVLERRFTKTAKREAASAAKETREEVSELGRSLGVRLDDLADRMKELTATEDATIAGGLSRLRRQPSHEHITEMFETARALNALDGWLVTVPTSTTLTGPHLCFRWEPGAVRTGHNSIEYSGPRELRVTHDNYFHGRAVRKAIDVLWTEDQAADTVGMSVRNAIIASGEWSGDDQFDWPHTVRSLATALELAIQSRRRTKQATHLHGVLSEVLDHNFVMTTAGVESLDGRLIISADEVPFHAQMTPKERSKWKPAAARPDDISVSDWDWLCSRALEKFEVRPFRMRV
jgi:hypothetical protein